MNTKMISAATLLSTLVLTPVLAADSSTKSQRSGQNGLYPAITPTQINKSLLNTLTNNTPLTGLSGASSSAESKELAMIVGVFTEENQRRKGLAKKCVFALSQKLLSEGKTVCLFYDNPNAAKMYEKIGFKHTGGFLSMLKKK